MVKWLSGGWSRPLPTSVDRTLYIPRVCDVSTCILYPIGLPLPYWLSNTLKFTKKKQNKLKRQRSAILCVVSLCLAARHLGTILCFIFFFWWVYCCHMHLSLDTENWLCRWQQADRIDYFYPLHMRALSTLLDGDHSKQSKEGELFAHWNGAHKSA